MGVHLRGDASLSVRGLPNRRIGKPRKVRINTIGEDVLEFAFDAKPLHMPPHFGEMRRLMVEVVDLRRPVFFDNDHRVGIGLMDVSGGGTESGWVVGGGAEWRMTQSWSLSFEYLRFSIDDVTATGSAIFPPGAFPRFENDTDFDVFRLGAKWRL